MRKRFLIAALFAAIMAIALCACGQQGGSSASASADGSASAASAASAAAAVDMEALPADTYKTLADAFAVSSSNNMSMYNQEYFAYAFKDNGRWVRVVADMPEDMYKQLSGMSAPSFPKIQELVGPLAVKQADAFVDSEPVQADLDKLVGKKGSDLAAEGFTFDKASVEDGKTEVSATKLPYTYSVTFNGAIDNPDTNDLADAVKGLTVESINYQSLSFEAIRI